MELQLSQIWGCHHLIFSQSPPRPGVEERQPPSHACRICRDDLGGLEQEAKAQAEPSEASSHRDIAKGYTLFLLFIIA